MDHKPYASTTKHGPNPEIPKQSHAFLCLGAGPPGATDTEPETDMKIPKFRSVDEELEFWSTHSALEFMDQGEEVEIDFSGAREKRARRETQQTDQSTDEHR